MKVSCPACDSKYTIADEKVAGRKVKVRCKSCGGQILINGTVPPPPPDPNQSTESTDDDATRIYKGGEIKALTAEVAGSASKDAASKDAASKGKDAANKDLAPASAPEGAASPASQDTTDDGIVWSVNVSDNDERSLSTHEVVAGYLSGEFAGEVYVWRDGMDDWTSIPDAPELAEAIEAAKKQSTAGNAPDSKTAAKPKVLPSAGKGTKTGETAAPADTSAAAGKKQAARAAGAKRPQSAHDLFAAASAAGSELDVSVSESDEPAQKMTGARNENSVLFSLDALKAGITATPAAQQVKGKQRPASPRKKLEDLMATGPSLPGAAGASALTLNASQALLMAPAPPPPPPKPEPVVVASVAPAAAAAPLTPKKKFGLVVGIVGAIVAAGVVAGVTVALMTKQQPAPAVSVVAVPVPVPVASTPAATTPTPAEAKPAESAAQAEAKPAESASPSTAAAVKVASGGPAAGAKPAVGAGAPAGAAVAKAEAKKPETKKEEPAAAAPSGAGAFSKEAASQALSVAASQTSICKKPDGPTGQGKVQVTFAPSGRATTANIISGPFGGTAVGGCVSGVFKRAKVPAFSGDPVTVSKSFTISP